MQATFGQNKAQIRGIAGVWSRWRQFQGHGEKFDNNWALHNRAGHMVL
jgi:hypothetical protein